MQFALVIFLNTIAFTGMSSLLPVMPTLLLSKGFSISATSIPFLAIILARIFAKSFCRIFLIVEYKIISALCFLIYSSIFYFYGIVESKSGFIFLRIFEGLVEGILIVIFTDVAMSLSNKNNRGFYMGMFGSSFALGMIFGPLYAGILYAKFGIKSIFLTNIFIGIVGFAVSMFFNKFTMRGSKKIKISWNLLKIISFYASSILRRIYMFSFAIFLPIYATSYLDKTIAETSIMFATVSLVIILFSPFAGKLADKLSAEKLTFFTTIITGFLTFGIFLKLPFYTLFYSMLIVFSIAVSSGVKFFLDKIEEHPNRTEVLGIASSVGDISSVAVAVAIPLLSQKSIHLPWLFLTFCAFISVIPLINQRSS